jgi:hypothetical protein
MNVSGRSVGLLLALLLCTTARAQFDQFAWTLLGSSEGSGTVGADAMHLVSPAGTFGCPTGNEVWFETVTTAAGSVSAHFDWDNQDGCFGWWLVDAPFFRVGTETTFVDSGLGSGFEYIDFEMDVSFHVPAGTTLAFGAWSLDCDCGPGVLDLTSFTFEPDTWSLLGPGLSGSAGTPSLSGLGALQAGTSWTFSLVDCAPSAPAFLVMGPTSLMASFKGGVLVPEPAQLAALVTSPAGRIILTGTWPAGVPSGLQLVLQYWIADAAGPAGWAASNGVVASVP